jgi:predicted DNA-binding transcriptional regulator AlpA
MAQSQVTTSTNQLLNAKALGQILALSKRQIFRLNSCGKIPAPIRIGGAVRWSGQEIADWLAAGAPDRETWQARKAVRR